MFVPFYAFTFFKALHTVGNAYPTISTKHPHPLVRQQAGKLGEHHKKKLQEAHLSTVLNVSQDRLLGKVFFLGNILI